VEGKSFELADKNLLNYTQARQIEVLVIPKFADLPLNFRQAYVPSKHSLRDNGFLLSFDVRQNSNEDGGEEIKNGEGRQLPKTIISKSFT
jgi:hypothetical protein